MAEYDDEQSESLDAQREPIAFASVPDHELIRLIGRGSSGEVWLARNTLGSYRAVKIVYASTFRHRRPFDREFTGVEKFEPLSRLHESLMDILQVGRNEEKGYFYSVMELADDVASSTPFKPAAYVPKTLAREMAQRRRLPVPECLQIGAGIAKGLDFLHQRGLVHRDVKPSNIVFVNGLAKLADIGLVVELSEARSYVGTEGFIPPEGPGTVQADLYSLGKVLYEISTGKDRHDYPELPTQLEDIAPDGRLLQLNKIILRACRSDPRERYKSAAEMVADLTALERGESVPIGRNQARRGALVGLGLGLAIIAMIVTWLGYKRSTSTHSVSQAISRWAGEGDGLDGVGSHHGFVLTGTSFTNGVLGRAFYFNGTNGGVIISNSAALNFSSNEDFSIEAWIRPEFSSSTSGVMSIVDKRKVLSVTNALGYELGVMDGRLFCQISDSLTQKHYMLNCRSAEPELRDGKFHHVAWSLPRTTTNGGRLYVDGEMVLKMDGMERPGDLSNDEPLRIGQHPDPEFDGNFKGTIDEVALYRRALSEEEVQKHFQAGPLSLYVEPGLAEQQLVLPAKYKDVPGDGVSGIISESLRLQSIYAASQFPKERILIKELRFRPAAMARPFSATLSNIQINLSTTHSAVDSIKSTFAENIGTDDTTVFSGTLPISSAAQGARGSPKDFDIRVPFSRPFLFDPSKGNLLMDARNYLGAAVSYAADATGTAAGQAGHAQFPNPDAASTSDIGAGTLITELIYTPAPE